MKSLCSKKGFSNKYCDCLYGFYIYKRLFVKSSDLKDRMEDFQHRKAAEKKKSLLTAAKVSAFHRVDFMGDWDR